MCGDAMTKVARLGFAWVFISLIALFCCHSLRHLWPSIGRKLSCQLLKERLADELLWKEKFVDLNGGMARLVGRRMCNLRMLYADGSIGYQYSGRHASDGNFVGSVARLANYVNAYGVPFLYVQAPAKFPLRGNMMPTGWEFENPNIRATCVVGELDRLGVGTLDLVGTFASTEEDVETNFFRTDHHWRIHAAFNATKLLADRLADLLNAPALRDAAPLMEENWERRMADDGFLGSHGRRTGRFFAGVDDFAYYVPRFKTDIVRTIDGKRPVRGAFVNTLLDLHFLSGKSIHKRNAYVIYGRDAGRVSIQNENAMAAVRVMIVKDSFANPVVAFLSTVCREVIVVDPRKLGSMSGVVDIVADCRPDVVVELVNPGTIGNPKYMCNLATQPSIPK